MSASVASRRLPGSWARKEPRWVVPLKLDPTRRWTRAAIARSLGSLVLSWLTAGAPPRQLRRSDAIKNIHVDMSSPGTPKWKIVENVVTAIERSLNTVEGAKVIPNASIRERISGVARQVDVYVEIPTGPRILRVGVEVRDESVPVDLPEIEQLITKLKKLDVDYGCVVSRAGFTATATAEADRYGVETRTIAEVENPDWWLATSILLNHRQ